MSNRKFENEGAEIARRLKFLGPGYKSDPWGAITPVAGYVQKPDANGYLSYVGGNGGASGDVRKITKEMVDQRNAVEKAKWQKANANARAASYPNTNVGSPAQVAANTAVSGGGTASPSFASPYNAGLIPSPVQTPVQAAAAAPVQTPAQAAAQKAVSPYQAWLDGSQGQEAAGAGQLLADEAARIRAGGGPTMDNKKMTFLTTLADQYEKYTAKANAPTLQQRREQMWDKMHKAYGSDTSGFQKSWSKYTGGH